MSQGSTATGQGQSSSGMDKRRLTRTGLTYAVHYQTATNRTQDVRRVAYDNRTKCYNLIHRIITAVDEASKKEPEPMDGHISATARRRSEAYDEINNSDDEVFQTNLYDWYLSQGWSDRLLDISSPYVVTYLERKSTEDITHADLLWRYHANYHDYLQAAAVQLQLAKSGFDLSLEARIEYLSRAKTNASTRLNGMAELGGSRQSRQELLREITDLLDIANIQEDLVERMKSDPRLTPERAPVLLKPLTGQILSLSEVRVPVVILLRLPLVFLRWVLVDHRSFSTTTATKPATSTFACSSTKPPTIATQPRFRAPGSTSLGSCTSGPLLRARHSHGKSLQIE